MQWDKSRNQTGTVSTREDCVEGEGWTKLVSEQYRLKKIEINNQSTGEKKQSSVYRTERLS